MILALIGVRVSKTKNSVRTRPDLQFQYVYKLMLQEENNSGKQQAHLADFFGTEGK